MKQFSGRAWVCGDHVDTDLILPSTYLNSNDPAVLGLHCLEALRQAPGPDLLPGQVIVAGRNFGNGSTREQALVALFGAGVTCVLAESFARGFYRNAWNRGLLIISAPGIRDLVKPGALLTIEPRLRQVFDENGHPLTPSDPISNFLLRMLEAGGVVPYLRQHENRFSM